MKNHTKRIGIKILTGILISLCTTSCSDTFDTSYFEKEINDLTIGLGLKLGYSEYTASEMFEEISEEIDDGSIEVSEINDNGKALVSFSYKETLKNKNNDDFINVDKQIYNGNLGLLADTDLPGGVNLPYNSSSNLIDNDEFEKTFYETNVLENDFEIENVHFSSGVFKIDISTTTEAQTVVLFTIPSLIGKNSDNAGVFSHTFILNNNGPGGDINSFEVNLDDYYFDLTFTNVENDPYEKGGFNSLATILNTVVTFEDGDNVSSDNTLTYDITMDDLEVKYAEGDFKNGEYDLGDETFNLDFLSELSENGNVTFENPILKLKANNGLGFPIGLILESIVASDGITDTNLEITDNNNANIKPVINGTGNYAVLDAPTINNEIKVTDIVLDGENSNIADLLNNNSTQIKLNTTANVNPNSTGSNNNFFDIDNNLDVELEIELPLHVTFDNLSFSPDTIDFDIDDLEDSAEYLAVELYTRNTIPLTGSISLKFLDSNGNTSFSKDATLMKAAPVDTNGFSTYTIDTEGDLKEGTSIIEPTITIVEFTTEEISNLTDVTKIQPLITFDTTDKAAVKIQSTDKVRLDLSAVADFVTSLSGDNEDDDNDNN